MKKAFLIVSLLVFTMLVKAQGNLQFNAVKTYGGSGNSATWTVPSNKVWKIEYAMITINLNYGAFAINGISVLGSGNTPQPIWLKAGDYCAFINSFSANPYFISIIEFNIIP